MSNTKFQDCVSELQRCYDVLKEHLPLSEKCKEINPIITIQTRGNKKALGWFWAEKWQNGGEEIFPEINICAETMNRTPEHIIETLVHEMVHLDNWANDIEDCNSVQYHNRAFKIKAEEFGLVVEKLKGKGYAYTQLGDTLKTFISSEVRPNKELLTLTRVQQNKLKVPSPYISILLKKEDYEELIEELLESNNMEKPKELVMDLLEKAYSKLKASS